MRIITNDLFFANIVLFIVALIFSNGRWMDMAFGGLITVFLIRMLSELNSDK